MTRGGMTRSYGPAKGRGEGAGRGGAVTWARGGDRLEIPRQYSCQLGDIPISSPPPSPKERDDDVTTMMMTTIPFWISVVDGMDPCTFRCVGGSYAL